MTKPLDIEAIRARLDTVKHEHWCKLAIYSFLRNGDRHYQPDYCLCESEDCGWYPGPDAEDFLFDAANDIAALLDEVGSLRTVCSEAYQMAGALDAPTPVLDNLSAAANGRPLSHESFLPVATPDLQAEVDALKTALIRQQPFDAPDWCWCDMDWRERYRESPSDHTSYCIEARKALRIETTNGGE